MSSLFTPDTLKNMMYSSNAPWWKASNQSDPSSGDDDRQDGFEDEDEGDRGEEEPSTDGAETEDSMEMVELRAMEENLTQEKELYGRRREQARKELEDYSKKITYFHRVILPRGTTRGRSPSSMGTIALGRRDRSGSMNG